MWGFVVGLEKANVCWLALPNKSEQEVKARNA